MPTHAAGAVERRVGGSPAGEPVRRKVRGRGRSGSGDTAARRHDRHRARHRRPARRTHSFRAGPGSIAVNWSYPPKRPARRSSWSSKASTATHVSSSTAPWRPIGRPATAISWWRWITSSASGNPTSCGSRPAVARTAGGMREPASIEVSGSSQRGGSISRPATYRCSSLTSTNRWRRWRSRRRCATSRSTDRPRFSGPSWWTLKARWWRGTRLR